MNKVPQSNTLERKKKKFEGMIYVDKNYEIIIYF